MAEQQSSPESDNPLGIDGLEFVEYATSEPQQFGAVLEMMGFVRIGRHRSREVFLYRQGSMNVVVNGDSFAVTSTQSGHEHVVLSAVALRVRDASYAYHRTVGLGAWAIPTRAGAMELNIPGIHGAGDTILYFVDRQGDFSIYDVDFKALAGVDPKPPALAGLHFFGVVQYIAEDRRAEWIDFYEQLFGFRALPEGPMFGILQKGTLLESPCRNFYVQLIEPPQGPFELNWVEKLARLGLGTPDVMSAVHILRDRGVQFEDRDHLRISEKGALTERFAGGVHFELVASHLGLQGSGS